MNAILPYCNNEMNATKRCLNETSKTTLSAKGWLCLRPKCGSFFGRGNKIPSTRTSCTFACFECRLIFITDVYYMFTLLPRCRCVVRNNRSSLVISACLRASRCATFSPCRGCSAMSCGKQGKNVRQDTCQCHDLVCIDPVSECQCRHRMITALVY